MIRINQYLLVTLLILIACLPSLAIETQGDLFVTILRADNDKPIVGALVKVQDKAGRAEVAQKTTDDNGQARFTNLQLGDYYVEISHAEYESDRALVKINAGAETAYKTLLDVKGQAEKVIKFKEDKLLVNGKDPNDGAVIRRDRQFVQEQLTDRSLQGVLATVPGTNINSVGQVHVRGDHKSVNFQLDGLSIPIPPASSTTPPIDLDFLDNLEARTGSYNGSQSGMGGLVLNGLTDWGTREPYFELRPTLGTQGTAQIMLRLGGSSEDGNFSYLVGGKTGTTNMQFQPPSPNDQTLNNKGQNTNVLARFRWRDQENEWGTTISHQAGLYGIAQTPQNFAAGVRQEQQDTNTVGLFSWKRKVDEDSDLQMGLAYLRSRQTVHNNGVFTPFSVFDENRSEELAEEGFPADPTNPGAPYLPTTNTLITQIQPSLQFVHRMGDGERIVAGADANFIRSQQDIDILDLGGGGGLPQGALRFQSNVARAGFSGGMYFSHTLPLTDEFTANYGVRLDRFSNGINVNTGQISPFANLAFAPTAEDVLRFSYHRLFQAPPLELDLSFGTETLPQRVHQFELSYEHQFGNSLTGKVALVRKDYRDQIDIGQLVPIANIPVYAPVNFARALYEGLELSVASHNKTGFNGFVTGSLSRAKPTAQGSAPEFPTFNDHDQRVQVTAGLSHTWENGLTAAGDVYYGSGFPQEALQLYNAAGVFPYGYNAQRVPRFLANLSLNYWPKREPQSVEYGGSLQILNLFDNRPLLNFFSDFSGTRFIQQRRILLNGMIRF
ncbi:MAG: carboxypeptidase regulatory-like domain-containing protein [Candidatus Eremiobacteraeota bacterium]|nr:carboxypeptidase regulatory-like domain-containing protein [Candidatus Eremiobacteraeota bacterium]MCW5871024.1 carboxypeptidase regulatory-like domain-containing protein [Candidatus Eremiobacteraeota bacterium]